MSATVKLVVLLAVLAGVVFGVTFLAQYSPSTDSDAGGKGTVAADPPLGFFSGLATWDPTSAEPATRYFPGYYETSRSGFPAHFWFENKNRSEVALKPAHTSCGSCSSGAVAVVPAGRFPPRLLEWAVAVQKGGAVPPGPFGPFVVAAAAAEVYAKLDWKPFQFSETEKVFTIPAAPPGGSQLGILRLNFATGGEPGPKTLTTGFTAQNAGTGALEKRTINIAVMMAAPFEVAPTDLAVGDLTAETGPRAYDVVAYSSVRDPGEFPPPVSAVRDADPVPSPGREKLVTVGEPVALSAADRDALAARLGAASGRPVRVRAAYRATITVRRPDGDAPVDIGPFERKVFFAAGGYESPHPIIVKGAVRGGVWLSDGPAMNLGEASGKRGWAKEFEVTVEDPADTLAVAAGQSTPPFLDVSLARLPDRGDRGYYRVTVRVPPGELFGDIKNGLVVLDAKGPRPARVRIPVQGKGTFQ